MDSLTGQSSKEPALEAVAKVKTMLEDQPLDLSVRVGDYAEFAREENDHDQDQDQDRRKEPIDDYGNAAAALRLRGCFVSGTSAEYSHDREDRTCSEDSDDSCSDNNQKDPTTRSRSRPPGTKPYKKNLMRRYRESRRILLSLFSRRFRGRHCAQPSPRIERSSRTLFRCFY